MTCTCSPPDRPGDAALAGLLADARSHMTVAELVRTAGVWSDDDGREIVPADEMNKAHDLIELVRAGLAPTMEPTP